MDMSAGGSPNEDLSLSVADKECCTEGFNACFPLGFEGTFFLEEATAAAMLVFILIISFEKCRVFTGKVRTLYRWSERCGNDPPLQVGDASIAKLHTAGVTGYVSCPKYIWSSLRVYFVPGTSA